MHLVLAAVSSPPWHNLHAVRQRARTHIKNAHATRGVAFVVVVVATILLVVVVAVALCTEQSCCRILTQFLLPAGQTSDSRTSVEILWPHSCTCLDTEASLNYKLCACERERDGARVDECICLCCCLTEANGWQLFNWVRRQSVARLALILVAYAREI